MPPKAIKPLDSRVPNYKQKLQHDVQKAQEKDRIKPNEIFEMMGAKKSKPKKKKSKY
jgi:hypothetical protein